jgi:DNA-binding NtrC family response regulator
MTSGAFRRDLYYRLGVVTLTLPPLRERTDDIPPLVLGNLERISRQLGRSIEGVDDDVLQALIAYGWPGNVRELFNVLERCVLLAQSDRISIADLPEEIVREKFSVVELNHSYRDQQALAAWLDGWLDRPLRQVRDELIGRIERAYLAAQLRAAGGRVGDTARASGISSRALYEKMRRYGLRKEDFRSQADL